MDITPYLDKPTAIVGTTGSGKTFAAKGAVEQILALGRRVVIIDPTGAWYGLRSGADGKRGGYPVMIFGGDHADVPITDEGGKALALAIAERHVQCVIDLSGMTNGEKIRFMTPFLEHLYAKNKTALHLVVDEADEIAAQKLADGEQRMFGAFDKIVRRGRIKGFRPLMITQRPAVIHKNVLSQIGTLIAMKLTSPQDTSAIKSWVEGNADAGKAKEVMKSLATLQRGEGWVWSPADDVLERVTFPAITTFDSSKTPEDGATFVAPAMTPVDVAALISAMKPAEKAKSTTSSQTINPLDPRLAQMTRTAWERGRDEGYKQGYFDARQTLTQLFGDQAEKFAQDIRSNQGGKPGDIAVPPLAEDAHPAIVHSTPPIAKMSPKTRDAVNVLAAAAVEQLAKLPDPPQSAAPLPPARWRILVALRDLEAIGKGQPDKQTVAWFAEASPKSSAFSNNLGALRTAGMIEYPSQGAVALTDAARIITPTRPAPTHEHIMAIVAPKLAPAQRRMLDAAVAVYPGNISTEDLASAVGASPTSSAFSNNRGRLRSLGLIDYPSAGLVRAADLLFPGRK